MLGVVPEPTGCDPGSLGAIGALQAHPVLSLGNLGGNSSSATFLQSWVALERGHEAQWSTDLGARALVAALER